ncbi:MAG: DUF1573 domain-containing protein [Flavobacterium sp.]|nr:DUF1573 domain-containing protein [Flavobacterium sp.]
MLRKTLSLVVLSLVLSTVSCKDSGSPKITEEDMKSVTAETPAVTPAEQNVEPVAETTPTPVPSDGKLPKIEFNKVEHDFGTIKDGDKVETEFMVKNIGDSDLIIVDAQGSCGCTVPNPPKEPIKPGKSAPIKVTFDSTGKVGQQSKTVTLTTNTAIGKENFTIKANVTAKK